MGVSIDPEVGEILAGSSHRIPSRAFLRFRLHAVGGDPGPDPVRTSVSLRQPFDSRLGLVSRRGRFWWPVLLEISAPRTARQRLVEVKLEEARFEDPAGEIHRLVWNDDHGEHVLFSEGRRMGVLLPLVRDALLERLFAAHLWR